VRGMSEQTVKVQLMDAYWTYDYHRKVVPPYEWIGMAHDLITYAMHHWGFPLFIERKFFSSDGKVLVSREFTKVCSKLVLTQVMFPDYTDTIYVEDVGGADDDYVEIIWKNNAEKWVARGVRRIDFRNPPQGIIIGTWIGLIPLGRYFPDWVKKYDEVYFLKVDSKGHDEAPGFAVTDYECYLIMMAKYGS